MQPGFNYKNPCSEDVVEVDMKMKTTLLGKQVVMTKDNIQLTVDAIVYYRVVNPLKVKYMLGLASIYNAVKEAAQASIRTAVGESTLDNILAHRTTFFDTTKQFLQNQLHSRGIHIESLYLTEMILPAEIMRNLTAAAKQQRLSEAQIITAQTGVETAKLMKESSELLNTKAAMQIRYLEMLT